MKLILGDNQFFGVNHADLNKGSETSKIFNSSFKIKKFIEDSLALGLDGFMINSNDLGYRVIEDFDFKQTNTECHYSIPYPHKYAGIINDSGMIGLLRLVLSKLKISDLAYITRFLFSLNAKYLIPIMIRMELPGKMPKGSVVYLQNVVTDLIIGLKDGDKLIQYFIKSIYRLGYTPGLITLNPGRIYDLLGKKYANNKITICFNMNLSGFNVFPSVNSVETTVDRIKATTNWDLMAMSVLSSGSRYVNIEDSLNYIKNQNIDSIVFGSSKLENIKSNIDHFND